MKHLYLNLKRFDVPVEYGGVNRIAPLKDWGSYIVAHAQEGLKHYDPSQVECVQYFPEAAMWEAGCEYVLIGHCEERNDKAGILAEAGVTDTAAVNRLLNQEIRLAVEQGLTVLYCIGEKSEEQEHWQDVLGEQLRVGLDGVDTSKVVIGYEPVWSIGPGKTPAGKDYITMIARFVKERTGGLDVVYGGGLKVDNAEMLASIDEIDGGLIALTRFQGEIGFYPDEYLEIIKTYLGN